MWLKLVRLPDPMNGLGRHAARAGHRTRTPMRSVVRFAARGQSHDLFPPCCAGCLAYARTAPPARPARIPNPPKFYARLFSITVPSDPAQLIESHLEVIERIVGHACRRLGIAADDVDDVAAAVKRALVENDYAILRRFEGRSSLTTYLAMVITRLMADQYERSHGRWRPSSEAKRRGERAVLIENVIGKQRRTIGEAVPLLQAIDKSITREEVEQLATQLPQRTPRPREVELADENIVSSKYADTAAVDAELRG